ncbi:hypothetical protein MOW14_02610 [Acinetobacter indicus]|uniref:hypothetical protein n=2 Tax=Acinetobacter TaxID=469 RepID=UPI0014443E4C|nr:MULTISPECIES: hypothetical protein [Acinetobacter]MCP0920354.1 hypothetical protein [Acinetobacter indicus]QOW53795.1 hypothetical protein G0030_11605 [Acinetobacter indicus]QSQ92701.1 hypothetical protein J0W32_10735 [Acinetobacter indicus]UNW10084.1 hypothetical protein MOW14_02610 [Acinetobacter indicus]
MNEVLFVMKEMIENNTILMNFVMLIILFNLLLMFFTYIYNKIYISIYKDDFIDLFFGRNNGVIFNRVGGDLVVVAYWFLMRYSFEVISSRKIRFPSINDSHAKPFYMTPNAFKENIELFKKNRKGWLIFNLISFYITYILAIIFLIYIILFI